MTVAGGGNEIDTFRKLANSAGLAGRINFTGWVDRNETNALLKLCRHCRVAVPCGRHGNVDTRRDVIWTMHRVYSVGSLGEVIEDEVTGLVVQPGDVNRLSTALARAVSDPALRVQLGSAAERVFANKFDAAYYPDRICAIYHAAIAGTPGVKPTKPAAELLSDDN